MSSETPATGSTPNLDATIEQARDVADDAVGRLRETATTAADLVAEKAPAATAYSQQAIAGVAGRIDRSPDDTLMLAGVLTGGVWLGLVLSKAPKWLLAVALVPTAVVVLAVLPRYASRRTKRTSRPSRKAG